MDPHPHEVIVGSRLLLPLLLSVSISVLSTCLVLPRHAALGRAGWGGSALAVLSFVLTLLVLEKNYHTCFL